MQDLPERGRTPRTLTYLAVCVQRWHGAYRSQLFVGVVRREEAQEGNAICEFLYMEGTRM